MPSKTSRRTIVRQPRLFEPGEPQQAEAMLREALPWLKAMLSAKRGGKGHWTQWEDQHPDDDEVVELPTSYHLPSCQFAAANHYKPVQPCTERCGRLRNLVFDIEVFTAK